VLDGDRAQFRKQRAAHAQHAEHGDTHRKKERAQKKREARKKKMEHVCRRSFVGSRFGSRYGGGAYMILIAAREHLHHASRVAANLNWLLTLVTPFFADDVTVADIGSPFLR
jgi:hypothetical protein